MNMDVVIIDDDAVILFLHKILIQKSPLPSNVTEFKNASEGLNYLSSRRSETPLLVFLDINMPEINGWEILERIREMSQKIFVVMVTSSINNSDRQKAAGFPEVIEYLEKPLSSEACKALYDRLRELT